MPHVESMAKLMAHDQRREGERPAIQLLQEKNEWDKWKRIVGYMLVSRDIHRSSEIRQRSVRNWNMRKEEESEMWDSNEYKLAILINLQEHAP